MENTNENIIETIENDEFYQAYLSSNSKAVLLKSLSITEQVKKLGEGIELIGQELQRQVLENHDDLLQQASHAIKLENVLSTMNVHIQNLFVNAERLRTQISVSYNALENHTKVLERLHMASHILRQVNRLQQLSKRLSNTNDTVQKATILQELEQLALDSDLKDIEVVMSELRNVRTQQQQVIKLATGLLHQGINNENQTQTTTALQIFINLGNINEMIENYLEEILDHCRQYLRTAFEISSNPSGKSKGTPGRISLTNSQGFRAKIWVELDKSLVEDTYNTCKQVKFLHKTLNTMHIQNIDSNIAPKFWKKLGEVLQEEIQNSSSAVKQCLEEEYPKLLKSSCEMIEKLRFPQFSFDRSIYAKYENSYLSMSLTRMLDPTQAMFGLEGFVPTHDQIDALVRVLTNELGVSLIEEHLSEQTAKNVAKSIKMFAVKTEQQLETGPEAAQVIAGAPNSGQQKNTQFANALYYLETQIQRILMNMKESLTETGVETVNQSLKSLDNLVEAILTPLIASINSVIETILVTIHMEPDWNKLQVSANKTISCSPYMREFNDFVMRVYNTYLAGFDNKEVLSNKCKEISLRSIDLLVRHSSLLRPISQGGRVRLQADYQQLETTLKGIYPQLPDLGPPYRLLRSAATLVVQPPADIVAGQVRGGSVPHSTILLMLFSFAGAELTSPHQNTGWSLPKLSNWLDEHPNEHDRLDLIAGALQKYETLVRQKNTASYDPVYPIMSKFLEEAVKNVNTL